ncbi:orotate phosphoribosyltransferase [Deinococcus irradiatisoli]|uniref:Orotate phosphoribosyltransferase n=1 Tax=Deinococcus irradiatisoli TaxID=2202254 RepID=A0A2Z3JQG2_9DEIO|nr:orotate phosphoribosyltransferase [Deinococcus irradiatisoli]AWN23204.1 orotate phosphoribosyltransferase [Deinococcus irradiatisoli]
MTDSNAPLDVLALYKEAGALHEGRFLLASGRHSPYFLQSTTLLQYPQHTARLGAALADKLRAANLTPDFVIGPAMGGVVLAYEVARQLGTRALFAEKDGQGGMLIRQAFSVTPQQTFVAVEDVLTTGGSVLKAVRAAEAYGARCLGVACIVDRRQVTGPLGGYPLTSLLELYFETYLPSEVPDWLAERELQEI